MIIGCGSYEPIQWYQDLTQSQYPIYANPSLSLYQDFEFQSRLAVAKKGEEREYDKVLGSTFTKVWNAIKIGPMQNFGQRNQVGPKSQNGGEVVLQKGEWGKAGGTLRSIRNGHRQGERGACRSFTGRLLRSTYTENLSSESWKTTLTNS